MSTGILEQHLHKRICDYYDSRNISYQRDDNNLLTLVVNKEREIPVNILTLAEPDPLSLKICGRFPFSVPEEDREMVVMALQAMNQRLTLGRFQMNLSNGAVDYRVTLPLVGIETDDNWLETVLDDAFFYVTSRDEKLLALIRGEMTFEEFEQKVR